VNPRVIYRSAIEPLGYLTDRNLHAGEELDLGARLHIRGWTLARIDLPAVDHRGHCGSAFLLLLRRLWTRSSFGVGEVIRAAIGRPHFWFILRNDKAFTFASLVLVWWLTIAVMPFVWTGPPAVLAMVTLFLLPFILMSLRWRSPYKGLYSVTAWSVFALSLLPGLLRARISPARWIDSTMVKGGLPLAGSESGRCRPMPR
jgi:hypothetical protein